jgi:threonine dehydratase
VVHNRLALDVPAKGAEFDILVETQDEGHAKRIGAALKEKGYVLRMA